MKFSLFKTPEHEPRQIRLLAWVLFSVLMLTTFTLWQRSIDYMNDRLRRASDENSRIAVERLSSFFQERMTTLRRITQFCLYTDGIGSAPPVSEFAAQTNDPHQNAFEGFCEALLDEQPGFFVIIRTDRDGNAMWVAPHQRLPMETANLITADPILTRTFRQLPNSSFVSEPINLIGHGEGFVIGIPILRGPRVTGFVLGVLPYQGLFDNLMQPEMLRDFHIRILHGNRVVYPLIPMPRSRWIETLYNPIDNELVFPQPLFMGSWLVIMEPTTPAKAFPLNAISLSVLLSGVLFSVVISYLVYRWMARAAQLQIEARESRSSLEHTGMSLIEVRSQLELIINGVEEGIVLYDSDRKPILANMAFLSMFTMGDDSRLMQDASAHHEHMIQTIGSESRYWSLFEAMQRWPEQQYTDELTLPARGPKRKPRVFTRRAMTATDAGGEQRGMIVVYKDVTRDKAIDRAKDEFLANVTHELRSPLSSIKGFAEMMRRDPAMTEERRSEFVSIICEESERLQQLVEELLDLRRLEDQGMTFNPTAFDLKALIEELVAGARAILVSKNLTMSVEWSGSDDHRMQGDVVQLRRAIRNLLVNSAKYSPESGKIAIVGHSDRDRLSVDVHDQGSGIDERDLPHIFDKFYRGRRQQRQKGTGLGLAIVKHIVERHGGHIGVRSDAREGTTFRIELPRRLVTPDHPANLTESLQ